MKRVTLRRTLSAEAERTLDSLPEWTALKTSTPQQIENWLTNNVTDLASARRVLKLLLLALRVIARG